MPHQEEGGAADTISSFFKIKIKTTADVSNFKKTELVLSKEDSSEYFILVGWKPLGRRSYEVSAW